MNKNKVKAIALSYFRAAFAAALALFLTGNVDPKALAMAALAAVAAPALKALDKSAKDFGLVAK
jgi:hypothetical protein